MAKLQSSVIPSGFRVDSITVYNRGGGLVVRSRCNEHYRGTGTQSQFRYRILFRNQINLWRAFPKGDRPAFEGRRTGVTNYNMFVSHNMQCETVFLTRREAENGACVLTSVAVSGGTLPSIVVTHDGTAPVTDLSVGGLPATASTTVAELSAALVRENSGYCFGDELLYYLGLQMWSAPLDLPVVEVSCTRLVLSPVDYRTVQSATAGGAGFSVRGGRLAAAADVQGGMAWVHRRCADGGVLLSSQRMVCNNPYVELFSGKEALEMACRSYGVKAERPFLEPDSGATRYKGMWNDCLTH